MEGGGMEWNGGMGWDEWGWGQMGMGRVSSRRLNTLLMSVSMSDAVNRVRRHA